MEDNTENNKSSQSSDLRMILESITKLNYLNPDDIPNIPLYMDQVLSFLDEQLMSYKRFDDDKIMTKTMINNYTKNNLLPPPDKKKYSKNHLILLIFIYYFKNFLSISDIQKIFGPLAEKCFDEDAELSLDDVYRHVFDLEYKGMEILMKDVVAKYKMSNSAFPKTGDNEKDDALSTFAYICMLSFDVYVKKLIIEKLIDSKVPVDTKNGQEK